jgi:glycopeptide antibiotics resistance protein
MYIIYSFILFHLVTTTDFTSYSNNFIPFKEIMRYEITDPLFIRNILGNILLFVPFSYIVTDIVYMVCKKTNFLICTIYVLLTSLSIESIQYFIGRAFDIDDILLNFIGGIFGYIVWKIIHLIFKEN